MKIRDVPQTGKLGLTVTWPGRNGLIRRELVSPAQHNTDSQQSVRSTLTATARRFDALTDAQQDAWNTAAASQQTRATLGQSGPLTGFQLFTKINCTLAKFGQDQVDVPPALPEFGTLAPQNLVITNASGTIALKLTCPTSPGQNTVLRASAPQGSGTRRPVTWRVLGMCPTPAQGSADITSLYTARFGAPPAGKRVFIKAQIMQDGYFGPTGQFSARVPASA
jgi:hypothetical protein